MGTTDRIASPDSDRPALGQTLASPQLHYPTEHHERKIAMTDQRVYRQATVLNARIYSMKYLWTPADTYKGQKTQKPSHTAGFMVPKTAKYWTAEPALTEVVAALKDIFDIVLSPAGTLFNDVTWPIKDGDAKTADGKPAPEWSRGHWVFNASTGSTPNIGIVRNGQTVTLDKREGVKPGDIVCVGVTAAQKANDPKGVKLYLNSVLFMAAGAEIAVGNSVTIDELALKAKAQGLVMTGFGGGAPQPAQPQWQQR